jgi:hypothetical protein
MKKYRSAAVGVALLSLAVAAPIAAQAQDQIILPSRQIPAGTSITVKLLQNLSSATANVGDPVRVEVVGNSSGLPYGTILDGQVTRVHPATPRYPGVVDVEFGTSSEDGNGGINDIATIHLKGTVAVSQKPQDVGIGAGVGALLGLSRKRKLGDAFEGAALGALGGYGVDQAQKHSANDLILHRGAPLTIHLDRPLLLRTTLEAE